MEIYGMCYWVARCYPPSRKQVALARSTLLVVFMYFVFVLFALPVPPLLEKLRTYMIQNT